MKKESCGLALPSVCGVVRHTAGALCGFVSCFLFSDVAHAGTWEIMMPPLSSPVYSSGKTTGTLKQWQGNEEKNLGYDGGWGRYGTEGRDLPTHIFSWPNDGPPHPATMSVHVDVKTGNKNINGSSVPTPSTGFASTSSEVKVKVRWRPSYTGEKLPPKVSLKVVPWAQAEARFNLNANPTISDIELQAITFELPPPLAQDSTTHWETVEYGKSTQYWRKGGSTVYITQSTDGGEWKNGAYELLLKPYFLKAKIKGAQTDTTNNVEIKAWASDEQRSVDNRAVWISSSIDTSRKKGENSQPEDCVRNGDGSMEVHSLAIFRPVSPLQNPARLPIPGSYIGTGTFTANISGFNSPTYQWLLDGTVMPMSNNQHSECGGRRGRNRRNIGYYSGKLLIRVTKEQFHSG